MPNAFDCAAAVDGVCHVLMSPTYFDVFLKHFVNRKKWDLMAKKNNQGEMDISS